MVVSTSLGIHDLESCSSTLCWCVDIALYVRNMIMDGKSTLQSSELIRRTENPFAFTNGTTWIMSTAYLHGRYANLLVNPLTELCAEYSYNCIPVVESVF